VSGFLLDTNVISELVKSRPNESLLQWIDEAPEELLFLSVLTLGEIRKGITRLDDRSRRGVLESWLEIDLRERFGDRVLAVDSAVADRWGRISAVARTLPVMDGLLAATALHHNLTFVTRNAKNVSFSGCLVFNPWEA